MQLVWARGEAPAAFGGRDAEFMYLCLRVVWNEVVYLIDTDPGWPWRGPCVWRGGGHRSAYAFSLGLEELVFLLALH